MGAAVIERVGVAVVVRVPGPTQEQLTLGGLCLNQETGSNYFEVSVANDGNVLTRGAGNLTLTTKDGDVVFDRPVELGTVLSGDDTLLRIDAPLDPGPGSYVAELSLRQPNGTEIQAISDIDIGSEKINGCLAGAPDVTPPEPEGWLSSLPGGDLPWLIIVLVALVVLLVAVLGAREIVWRRRGR